MFGSWRTRALLASGMSVGLCVLMLPGASPALAGQAAIQRFTLGRAMYDVGVHRSATVNDAMNAPLAAGGLKTFRASVTDSGKTYKYVMVGKNPTIATSNASTTIKTLLVPLVINFPALPATWDPTAVDSCDPGASPLTRTQQSPLFVNQHWTWGGTSIGTGQYVDAFQRANFWTYAKPGGINPGYHVNLGLNTLSSVTINVPTADSAALPIGCGNGFLAGVEINWLDGYLQSTVIPGLASQGLAPNTFPIFLVHNVIEYVNTTATCCVLGYHNAYKATPASPLLTYALSIYDNSGAFSGVSDISALAHEVGEWVDDPTTNNPTRPWGHTGQVSGCQKNLEVGDPLSGTTIAVTSGAFTYHPQELAFFSWFYRQTPSLGVNGWYSNNGTFTTTQATCH